MRRTVVALAAGVVAVAGCGGSGARQGTEIAFISARGGATEIYLVDADGRHEHRLTHGDAISEISPLVPMAPPAWSPDGKWIAYENDHSTAGEIDVVRADGTDRRVLVRSALYPAWSPDGDLIAFTRVRGRTTAVWTVRTDGTGARRVVRGGIFSAWSPDGKRLAYVRRVHTNVDIYTSNLDGSDERRVTTDPAPDLLPAWAPAKEIAFVRSGGNLDIYVVRPDGTGERRVTDDLGADESPAWSPDGRRLAYVNDLAFTTEFAHGAEIFVIGADGTGRRRLTHNQFDDVAPAWAPAG
jgi:TolB protein